MKNVINKNTILALMVIGMMCFWGSMNANAQQFNVQGDLVSSYVWRGMYQTGASIQPTLGFSVGNFSLTAWGSTDFDGTSASAGAAAKEIDLQRPLLAQAADPVGGHRHIPAVAQTQQQIAVGSCRRRQRQQLLAEQRIGTRQQIFDPPVLDDRPVADLRHRIRRRAHG